MKKTPDLIFIIDTNVEASGSRKKHTNNGILDTNSDPTGIDYPIPGNDVREDL